MTTRRHALTPRPPLGWNSYDCLGCFASERRLLENLRVFVERLKPHGYEYFVLDGGWYRQYELGDREFPVPGEPCTVGVDEFGRPQPSPVWFPNGLAPIAAACHAAGVKFGLHMMRGVPRVAVERNVPIAGTAWRARDVANPADGCSWCPDNCGVNVAHPGGRAYYASVIAQLADWGVDFIKYDDMIPAPDEVDAVADALEQCPRPIVLSLSPGDGHHPDRWATYQRANLIRLTGDIWDDREGFAQVFERWQQIQDRLATWPAGCWVDQDMIPFGELCLWNPDRGVAVGHVAFAGKGVHRRCQFTPAQQRTFLAMRALGASPLFMGGHLPGTEDATFALLTDPDLLACNQNATPGRLTMLSDTLALWQSPERDAPGSGWLGLFNRDPHQTQPVTLDPPRLGLPRDTALRVIWGQPELPADDVLFVRYTPAQVAMQVGERQPRAATSRQWVAAARQRGRAVPAFNIPYLPMMEPIVAALRDANCGGLIMVARLEWTKFAAGSLEAVAAEYGRVGDRRFTRLHLDHVPVIDEDQERVDYVGDITRALAAGYESVMVDGSRLALAENIAATRRIVELAHARGVAVEGELGAVLGHEAGPLPSYEELFASGRGFTDVAEAARFVRETGVDWLSVAVGSVHGAISAATRHQPKVAARLHIERLDQIRAATGIPLVLHGGTGIRRESVHAAMRHGIAKINIATATRQPFEQLRAQSLTAALQAVYDVTRAVLRDELEMENSIAWLDAPPSEATHEI